MKPDLANTIPTFASATIARNEIASPEALAADRDAHIDAAAQLARKVLKQVDAVAKTGYHEPAILVAKVDPEVIMTTKQFDKAGDCFRNMVALQTELNGAMEAQDNLFDFKDIEDPKWPDHRADKQARRLIIACDIHLSLDNLFKEGPRHTDNCEVMSPDWGERSKVFDLYRKVSVVSVDLMREALRDFIKAYNR